MRARPGRRLGHCLLCRPGQYVVGGAPVGPRAGSCGTAAYRAQPVVVTDIATDPGNGKPPEQAAGAARVGLAS